MGVARTLTPRDRCRSGPRDRPDPAVSARSGQPCRSGRYARRDLRRSLGGSGEWRSV